MGGMGGPGLWLAVAGVVFAVNLLPAFGPPTWAVLVWFRLGHDLPLPALVAVGVACAASGRFVLASAASHLSGRLGPRAQARLARAQAALGHRRRSWTLLVLFLLSPLPSAQLFVSAGLMRLDLRPLAVAFALGRTVSYSLYLTAATKADDQLGSVLSSSFTSPVGIAVQVLLLVLAVALPLVDWPRVVAGLRPRPRVH